MTRASHIIAAAREVDGQGSLTDLHATWSDLRSRGNRVVELIIDPLAAGWDTPVAPNHFRSGCAPIEALAYADQLIREGRAESVLIQGRDFLRSDYANDKETRRRLMSIYGECSIPEAYTLLAHAFMRHHSIDAPRFLSLAHALFDNYIRTAKHSENFQPPKPEAYEMVTDLFRIVDCANPIVDFAGAMILSIENLAPPGKRLVVRGVGISRLEPDAPANVEQLAHYDHLASACKSACEQANIDLAKEFHAGRALVEAYTCFPVAPLGFLLASGIAKNVDAIAPLLATNEITVTGGMNLARAAWNNPALNALIVMSQRLLAGDAEIGAVHGNGGLGYRQGLAILGVQ